jgi:hypothetical protein
MPCHLTNCHRSFKELYCLHLEGTGCKNLQCCKVKKYSSASSFCNECKSYISNPISTALHQLLQLQSSVSSYRIFLLMSGIYQRLFHPLTATPPTRRNSPTRARAASCSRFVDYTQWHTTVGRTSLEGWSARLRDLYLTNTQHSQRTNIHAPRGIRTRNPSRRSAVNPRLRPLGHWDRHFNSHYKYNIAFGELLNVSRR